MTLNLTLDQQHYMATISVLSKQAKLIARGRSSS